MSVIDEVKQKTDIADIIGQYTQLKKAGRNLSALCPFHGEKTPSFIVFPEQQSWHCFGACSTGGDVFSFMMKQEGIEFGEALKRLADRAGVILPAKPMQDTHREENERLHQMNEAASLYFHNLLVNAPEAKNARDYLVGRSINAESIEKFRLGYSLNSWDSLKKHLLERSFKENEMVEAGLLSTAEGGNIYDRFRNKIMFPISDIRGRVIGFGARMLDNSLPKYINSPQTPLFDKSGTLYGINLAAPAIRKQDAAIITEGYMDVIIPHQFGVANAVASMGTAITDKQVEILKKLTRNILLVLDSDAAGEEAMLRCIQYEDKFDIDMKFVILPPGKDPDEIIKEDIQLWRKLTEAGLPVVDYTATISKERAVERLIPIISKMEDDLRRDRYLSQLEKLTGIRYEKLEAAAKALRTRSSGKIKGAPENIIKRSLKPLTGSPLEEECLALVLQHPELKNIEVEITPDYFEASVNREIFSVWLRADGANTMREMLDTTLQIHYDSLIKKPLLATRLQERYNDYVLNLKKEYYRNLERKRAAILTAEAETGGAAAEIARLKEQGLGASIGLQEVFSKRAGKKRQTTNKIP